MKIFYRIKEKESDVDLSSQLFENPINKKFIKITVFQLMDKLYELITIRFKENDPDVKIEDGSTIKIYTLGNKNERGVHQIRMEDNSVHLYMYNGNILSIQLNEFKQSDLIDEIDNLKREKKLKEMIFKLVSTGR